MERSSFDSLDSLEGVPPQRDMQLTTLIASVLRAGVILAGIVVLAGFALILLRHQGGTADFHQFAPRHSPVALGVVGVFQRSLHRHAARDVIDLGLLLLILTPVVRVAFSIVIFLYERDPLYVWFTLTVLVVLIYSLLGGG